MEREYVIVVQWGEDRGSRVITAYVNFDDHPGPMSTGYPYLTDEIGRARAMTREQALETMKRLMEPPHDHILSRGIYNGSKPSLGGEVLFTIAKLETRFITLETRYLSYTGK